MSDIVDIGSSRLDGTTNTLVVTAKTAPVGASADSGPGFGEIPMACALGLTARPAPANQNGNAQGVVDESLPGANGWVIGARDTRVSKFVGELADGETVLHSTGDGFDAGVFCKDQLLALVVGDDTALVLDRKERKVTLTAFGCHIEASAENGIVLAQGGAMLRIKDGVISLVGQVVLGGLNPTMPFCASPTPVVGTSGSTSPTPGVFLGT